MSEQRIVLGRRRGEPILLGVADHRDGVVSFSLKAPREVGFATVDGSQMTILGVGTFVSGSFPLHADLSLKTSSLRLTSRTYEPGDPALFVPDDRDEIQMRAVELAIAAAWEKVRAARFRQIHEARHDAVDDYALYAMAYRRRMIDRENAPGVETSEQDACRACRRDAIQRLASNDADLWSMFDALEDRPGYVVTLDGEVQGKSGWRSPVPKGWIPSHVHNSWAPANEVAEQSGGVVHRVRIARGDVRVVRPDCLVGGMARPGAVWPAAVDMEMEDA